MLQNQKSSALNRFAGQRFNSRYSHSYNVSLVRNRVTEPTASATRRNTESMKPRTGSPSNSRRIPTIPNQVRARTGRTTFSATSPKGNQSTMSALSPASPVMHATHREAAARNVAPGTCSCPSSREGRPSASYGAVSCLCSHAIAVTMAAGVGVWPLRWFSMQRASGLPKAA